MVSCIVLAILLKLRESSPISSELFTIARSSYFPFVKRRVFCANFFIGEVSSAESPISIAALMSKTIRKITRKLCSIACFSSIMGVMFLAVTRHKVISLCENFPAAISQYSSARLSIVCMIVCSLILSIMEKSYSDGKSEKITLLSKAKIAV